MLKGKAELADSEKGIIVAMFHEVCHQDGTVWASVRLKQPLTLKGTDRLEVFSKATATPAISAGASDPDGTEICEFHGKSSIGFIPNGTDVSLVRTPGGPLGTLLIVLGQGQLHQTT
jgi:hypothetical protein